ASSSSRRCRRREARRSSVAPCGRPRSGKIPGTCPRLRTPTRSRRSLPLSELDGKVALVTGGGRGIGAGIARELASAGARVAVTARTPDQVESVAREIDGLPLVVDVSDWESVQAMVAQAEAELGPVDVLVNNAGVSGSTTPVWEVDPADW